MTSLTPTLGAHIFLYPGVFLDPPVVIDFVRSIHGGLHKCYDIRWGGLKKAIQCLMYAVNARQCSGVLLSSVLGCLCVNIHPGGDTS